MPHASDGGVPTSQAPDQTVQAQVLPFDEFLAFCRTHRLPTNDAWLFSGTSCAAVVRRCLDRVAKDASPTKEATGALDAVLVSCGGSESVRVRGSYPHHEWQGTRIEGFVVAQGDAVSPEYSQKLRDFAGDLGEQVLHVNDVEDRGGANLVRFATALLGDSCRGAADANEDATASRGVVAEVLPELDFLQGSWEKVSEEEAAAVQSLLKDAPVATEDGSIAKVKGDGGGFVLRRHLAAANKATCRAFSGVSGAHILRFV
jgi:hypothetical protein